MEEWLKFLAIERKNKTEIHGLTEKQEAELKTFIQEKGDDISLVDETMLWGEESSYCPFLKVEFQNSKHNYNPNHMFIGCSSTPFRIG